MSWADDAAFLDVTHASTALWGGVRCLARLVQGTVCMMLG